MSELKDDFPDDQFLVSFLRGCKFSYEKSKEKLDMYFTVRSAIPEFFYDRDPSYTNLKEAIRLGYVKGRSTGTFVSTNFLLSFQSHVTFTDTRTV